MQDLLVCVVGRSGSGKSTIVQELCKYFGKQEVISYATRPRREGEGNTHIFITDEEAKQYEDDFCAWTFIQPYQYFTTKTQLRNTEIMFYVIDPNGVQWLKRNFTDKRILVLYVRVNETLAQQRALARGDSIEVYNKRRESEREQFTRFEREHEYDVIIHNTLSLRYAVEDAITAIKYARMEDK